MLQHFELKGKTESNRRQSYAASIRQSSQLLSVGILMLNSRQTENVEKSKVFCIGLGKTGTSTFGAIMADNGYRHSEGPVHIGLTAHTLGDYDTLFEITKRFDSFDDYPWPFLYKFLEEKYPSAKFVLTTRRNSDVWLRSLISHNLRQGPKDNQLMSLKCYLPMNNAESLKKMYEDHNLEVRRHFAKSKNFIEVCWDDPTSKNSFSEFFDINLHEGVPHQNSAKDKDSREFIERLLKNKRPGAALLYAGSQGADLKNYTDDRVRDYIKNGYQKLCEERWGDGPEMFSSLSDKINASKSTKTSNDKLERSKLKNFLKRIF